MAYVAQPVTYDGSEIRVPPAHSTHDSMIPIVASTVPCKPEPRQMDSGYITPVSNNGGSRSVLEASTGDLVTRIGEDHGAEDNGGDPDLFREQRLVREGKLLIVENPRYHQAPVVPEPSGADVPTNEEIFETHVPALDTSIVNYPSDHNIAGIRKIRQSELSEPSTGPPPGVPLSVAAEEPQTPEKSTKCTGSPFIQRSGFLGSLRKVFSGGHRETSLTPQGKAREKEVKERETREKSREREVRREGHLREQDEHDRQIRMLTPSRRDRKAARRSKSMGIGKKADKEGASESRKDKDLDEPNWIADGYLVRKNTELERNLKGGVLEAKRKQAQEPGSVPRPEGDSVPVEDRRWDSGMSSKRSAFIVEHGAKCTKNSSASPSKISGGQSVTHDPNSGYGTVLSVPQVPRLSDTRFREEFNRQNRTLPKLRTPGIALGNDKKDKDNADDTSTFDHLTGIDGMLSTPVVVSPATNVTVAPNVARQPSKKQSFISLINSSEGAGVGKYASVLNRATAPAGMSTGLGGRRGSVGVSVVTPCTPAASGSHRRAVNENLGPLEGVSTPPVSQGPRESLMSIVHNVTRSNRRAWDTGLMVAKTSRARDTSSSDVRNSFPGPISSGAGVRIAENAAPVLGAGRDGLASDVDASRIGLDGQSPSCSEVMSTTLRAPVKVDRQSLMICPEGAPDSPDRAQSTTANVHGTRPLKSALRMSRSPLPHGAIAIDGHGYTMSSGKDRLALMPVEDPNGLPPPVGRVPSVSCDVAEYGQNDEDEGNDSASTSSYETGHEDFDDDVEPVPQRLKNSEFITGSSIPSSAFGRKDLNRTLGLVSLPLVMPSPTCSRPMSSEVASAPTAANAKTQLGSLTSTPSKRKSVRVSLNPTFSPAPPAIEEGDEVNRVAFVSKEVTLPPVKQVPRDIGAKKNGGNTIWDDDSDDNADYQRAKMLLLKATRREKQAFNNSTNGRY